MFSNLNFEKIKSSYYNTLNICQKKAVAELINPQQLKDKCPEKQASKRNLSLHGWLLFKELVLKCNNIEKTILVLLH
jgi:hypothetical protein